MQKKFSFSACLSAPALDRSQVVAELHVAAGLDAAEHPPAGLAGRAGLFMLGLDLCAHLSAVLTPFQLLNFRSLRPRPDLYLFARQQKNPSSQRDGSSIRGATQFQPPARAASLADGEVPRIAHPPHLGL